MGKIKSKLVIRTVSDLQKEGIEFSESFEENKRILGNLMPSKKLRNQIAGLATRVKKQQKIKDEMLAQ